MQYQTPPEIDVAKLRREAARRRQALTQAGCSTYALGKRDQFLAIQCLCCGLGSLNQLDVQNRYCGFCEATHSEWRN